MYDSGGRIVVVHPDVQIVDPMSAWVTAGLVAPGVHVGSGRTYSPLPRAWHVFGAAPGAGLVAGDAGLEPADVDGDGDELGGAVGAGAVVEADGAVTAGGRVAGVGREVAVGAPPRAPATATTATAMTAATATCAPLGSPRYRRHTSCSACRTHPPPGPHVPLLSQGT